MRYNFLQLSDINASFAAELKNAACNVIDSGIYLSGPYTNEFINIMSHLHGGSYCVPVSNGLDALRLILRGYIELGRLAPGDEVIVPANTYIASVLAISDAGLVPVFAEPDAETNNLDFSRLEEYITPRTRAVMIVHLYGTPAWDFVVASRLRRDGILIIEDNAQSIGALAREDGLNGLRITGTLGDAAGISFYPTKNVGALGDAGAVLTFDEKLKTAVKAIANYGADKRYHNIYRGFNCRMDEIQAAFLSIKLRRLDEINSHRIAIANIYCDRISNDVVNTPVLFPDMKQVWHQYVVHTPYRNALIKYLDSMGVGTDIHYAVPPHLQPCYRPLRLSLPVTENLASTALSLPIGAVTQSDAYEISEIINAFKQ